MISYVTVLNRVKDFLPRMKEAGQQLEKELHGKSPSEMDIESVDDSAPYIEMVNMKTSLKELWKKCVLGLYNKGRKGDWGTDFAKTNGINNKYLNM